MGAGGGGGGSGGAPQSACCLQRRQRGLAAVQECVQRHVGFELAPMGAGNVRRVVWQANKGGCTALSPCARRTDGAVSAVARIRAVSRVAWSFRVLYHDSRLRLVLIVWAMSPPIEEHPLLPIWAGELGCVSAVEENGYPLGNDSFCEHFHGVARACDGHCPLAGHCWLSWACGRIVGSRWRLFGCVCLHLVSPRPSCCVWRSVFAVMSV